MDHRVENFKHFTLFASIILLALANSFALVPGDTLQGENEIYVSRLKSLLIMQEEHHSFNKVGDEIKAILEPAGVQVNVVQTSNSASVISSSVLPNYDVLLWSYAWEPQDRYNATQRKAIEDWFATGGKGVGCLHSCQRSNGWQFYRDAFGSLYAYEWNIPNNAQTMILDDDFKTHMMYDPEIDGDYSNPGGSEEYYLYDANPRDLPNTTVHFRVEETYIQSIAMGGDHPVVWSREVMGGRTYMNVLNHASHLINDQKRQQYVDDLTKSLYWLAGYDTISTIVAAECPEGMGVAQNGKCSPAINQMGFGGGAISVQHMNVSVPYKHHIKVVDIHGSVVFSGKAEDSHSYDLSDLAKGYYFVKVSAPGIVESKKVLIY